MRILTLLLLCLFPAGCTSPDLGETTPEVVEPAELRLLIYNIRHGAGMDDVFDLTRSAAVIRGLNPDFVCLQEIDKGTTRTDRLDEARELGQMTGMHSAFGSFFDYEGGEYGMALLSKTPFLSTENHRLPDGTEPRTSLAGRIRLSDGQEIVICGIHFYNTEEERLAQATALVEALKNESAPVFLAGDFNSLPNTPVMDMLAEQWQIIPKEGPQNTFPANNPIKEIDYVLVRPKGSFEVLECRVIEEELASDHRPVLVVLRSR